MEYGILWLWLWWLYSILTTPLMQYILYIYNIWNDALTQRFIVINNYNGDFNQYLSVFNLFNCGFLDTFLCSPLSHFLNTFMTMLSINMYLNLQWIIYQRIYYFVHNITIQANYICTSSLLYWKTMDQHVSRDNLQDKNEIWLMEGRNEDQ